MRTLLQRTSRAMLGLALAGAIGLGAADTPLAAEAQSGAAVSAKPVFSEKLPNVPGKTLTAVVVDFPPGVVDGAHRHAGSVFVYVLSGALRSHVSDSEEKVYRAGDSFFERPGTRHLMAASDSATEPARALAIFIADDGATLTTRDR